MRVRVTAVHVWDEPYKNKKTSKWQGTYAYNTWLKYNFFPTCIAFTRASHCNIYIVIWRFAFIFRKSVLQRLYKSA